MKQIICWLLGHKYSDEYISYVYCLRCGKRVIHSIKGKIK